MKMGPAKMDGPPTAGNSVSCIRAAQSTRTTAAPRIRRHLCKYITPRPSAFNRSQGRGRIAELGSAFSEFQSGSSPNLEMISKPKNELSSPSALGSFAAWFSSKLLSRARQSVGNESSSIRHLPTSPTQSLKRRAKSFLKKTISSSSTDKNISGMEQKGAGSGSSYSAGRSGRLLEAESIDEKARELQEVFAYFDGDGDGKISVGELRGVLKSLGEEMSEGEVRGMMAAVDSDGDGFIDLPDFIRLNTQICKAEDEELLEAFRMLDTEKGGFITPNGLRQLMVRLVGEHTTLHDCVLMIKPFDLDGDGAVSFCEFKRMMTGSQ